MFPPVYRSSSHYDLLIKTQQSHSLRFSLGHIFTIWFPTRLSNSIQCNAKNKKWPEELRRYAPTKISQIYPKDIPKISQRYPKNILKISSKYPQNIPKISPKYPQNIPKISQKYPQNILKISPKYPQNIPKISCDIIFIFSFSFWFFFLHTFLALTIFWDN